MAINIQTDNPTALLKAIYSSIDDGTIKTWEYDHDGDFTHAPSQWKYKAWLRPSSENGCLVLNIIWPAGESLSNELYAIYHGRFIEMLLAHFDDSFVEANATALLTLEEAIIT